MQGAMRGRPLVAGNADGELLASSEPLSFWGGYDQTTGEIIDRPEDVGGFPEIKGGEPFRVNAYRRAARVLSDLPEDIAVVADEGRLTDMAGVGKGTAGKIQEYLETGAISAYDEEMRGVPEGLLELLAIPGLGPRTIGLLWRQLDVRSLKGLRRELRRGSICPVRRPP